MEVASEPVDADAEGLHKLLIQDLARMHKVQQFGLSSHKITSVVIHDLHISGFAVPPGKADSPWIVNPDTVLSGAVALERLQVIPRRNAKVFQPLHRVEIEELASSDAFDRLEPLYGRGRELWCPGTGTIGSQLSM